MYHVQVRMQEWHYNFVHVQNWKKKKFYPLISTYLHNMNKMPGGVVAAIIKDLSAYTTRADFVALLIA